jgi:hypothetical protein
MLHELLIDFSDHANSNEHGSNDRKLALKSVASVVVSKRSTTTLQLEAGSVTF